MTLNLLREPDTSEHQLQANPVEVARDADQFLASERELRGRLSNQLWEHADHWIDQHGGLVMLLGTVRGKESGLSTAAAFLVFERDDGSRRFSYYEIDPEEMHRTSEFSTWVAYPAQDATEISTLDLAKAVAISRPGNEEVGPCDADLFRELASRAFRTQSGRAR